MLLTPQQLQEIQTIIANHHTAFIVNAISPEAVTKETLDKLKQLGLVDPTTESVKDAYLYGKVVAALQSPASASMSYPEFQNYLKKNPIPLSVTEKHAIEMATAHAAMYCRGLGNKVNLATGAVAIEADAQLRAKTEAGIQTATVTNIARRQSVTQLKTDLGWMAKDWSRDWNRIAVTEKQFAMQRGQADGLRNEYGEDVLVAHRAMSDACPHCIRLHVGDDGQPKIYKLSTLEANGSNVKKKANDWQSIVGPIHPNCQCVMVRVPDGWGFDKTGSLVPGGKLGEYVPGEDELTKGYKIQQYIDFQGLPIAIENKKGSVRTWKTLDGGKGSKRMSVAYGYVRDTLGTDEDEIDVFVGPDKSAEMVYIIHQQIPETGLYDEEKCMLGFGTREQAEAAYQENYDRDDFKLTTSPMSIEDFKRYVSVTAPKTGEMMKSKLQLVIPHSEKSLLQKADKDSAGSGKETRFFITQPQVLEKAGVAAIVGASTSRMGGRSPSPGTSPNFIFNTPDSKGNPKHGVFPEVKDLVWRESGELGDPLKMDRDTYEVGMPLRIVRPIELNTDFIAAGKEVREDAEERKEQAIERYLINVRRPANRVELSKATGLPVIMIGKNGGKIVGWTAKGDKIYAKDHEPTYMTTTSVFLKKHGGKVQPDSGHAHNRMLKTAKLSKLLEFMKQHGIHGTPTKGGTYYMISVPEHKLLLPAKQKAKPKLVLPQPTEPELDPLKQTSVMTDPATIKVIGAFDAVAKSEIKIPKRKTDQIQRGQKVAAQLPDGQDIIARIVGQDQRGDLRVKVNGSRRTVAKKTMKLGKSNYTQRSSLEFLEDGKHIFKLNAHQQKLMDDTLGKLKVVGDKVADEYVNKLWKDGEETYVVGGIVRDLLAGTVPGSGVSDGEIKEAMKDVDIVTTAPPPDCLKLVQDMGEGSGHTIYDSSKWGVIQSVNSGAGLDVASLVQSGGQDPVAINPDVEKIYGYQIHEPPLSFDHEIKGDMIRRDFACNSLYYDPVNRVMIDPTGTGIADAQNKVLRLSPSKEEGMKNDMLSLRYYKFRMRGYSSTQDTLEYMSGHFHKHMSGTKTSSMINMLHRVLQKEKTPEIALDKLRTVMFADGHGHLYNKFIKPKYNIIVQGLQAKKLKQ